MYTALVDVVLPLGSPFYLCVKQGMYDNADEIKNKALLFKHQGIESHSIVSTFAT